MEDRTATDSPAAAAPTRRPRRAPGQLPIQIGHFQLELRRNPAGRARVPITIGCGDPLQTEYLRLCGTRTALVATRLVTAAFDLLREDLELFAALASQPEYATVQRDPHREALCRLCGIDIPSLDGVACSRATPREHGEARA